MEIYRSVSEAGEFGTSRSTNLIRSMPDVDYDKF